MKRLHVHVGVEDLDRSIYGDSPALDSLGTPEAPKCCAPAGVA